MFANEYEFEYEKMLLDVQNWVPTIYAESSTKYDVMAYEGKNPVLFIEIQSSPMKETLGACVWKRSVLIRY